jgi:Ca-activated chloride channel family protein
MLESMNLFSHPWLLWFLALVPVLALLSIHSWRTRRRALALLGNVPALQSMIHRRRGARFRRGACFFAGIVLLIVGAAGPHWGLQHDPEAAVAGRDLIVVLDLSRSMLAEQPSRQERARRALRDLADELERHGGHRVALVVFAAKPHLVFPLSNDYDHFRASLKNWDADSLPPSLRPNAEEGPASGTRIGAALRLAAQSHDPRFQGATDIVLLSDGDDPGQDEEWNAGAQAARTLKIPIHAVGIGDPDTDSFIPFRDDFLKHNQTLVKTRLREKPLQEIAKLTGGLYLPARNRDFPLGTFFREVLEPRGVRTASEIESTAGLPIPKQQYGWFLGSALALLAGAMLISDRVRSRRRRPLPASLLLAPLALVLVSAAPPTTKNVPRSPVDDLIDKGNAAYAAADYPTALKWYEQAEERSLDPGLVAFNKAAALYRLERYAEAARHYQRSLEDRQAPPLRQARGYYDLGNCLVKQAGPADAKILEQAVHSFRDCLALQPDDSGLVADARHNLELATLLWLKARTAARDNPANNDSKEEPNPKDGKEDTQPGMQKGKEKGIGTKEEKVGKSPDGQEPDKGQKKASMPGKIVNLPDNDKLVPLPPEDTAALLEQAAQRILNESRADRGSSLPSEGVKDW